MIEIELQDWDKEENNAYTGGTNVFVSGEILNFEETDNLDVDALTMLNALLKKLGFDLTKHVFDLEPWDYTCGDGCCYDWGMELIYDMRKLNLEYSSYCADYKNIITTAFSVLNLEHKITQTYLDITNN